MDYNTNVLKLVLLRTADYLFGTEWTVQHDNRSVHKAQKKSSLCVWHQCTWIASQFSWFKYNFEFPQTVSQKDVQKGREFNDVTSLNNSIVNLWQNISVDYIKTLYHSISPRHTSALEKKS